MVIGLAVNSGATYGFFGLASRALGAEGFGHLSALWASTFVVGVGLFQPFEQELSRALSSPSSTSDETDELQRAAGLAGVLVVAALTVVLGAMVPLGVVTTLWGSVRLGVMAWIAIAGYAYAQIARGVLAGTRSFPRFGVYLAAEGLLRLAVAAALFVGDVDDPVWFGLAVAASYFVPAAIISRVSVRALPHRATIGRFLSAAGVLMMVAAGEAALVNVAPLAAKVVTSDETVPGALLAVSAIARVPLVAFVAVRVTVLPALSGLIDDPPAFRRRTMRMLQAAVPTGLVAVMAMAGIGPAVVSRAFAYDVARMDAAVVALSSVTMMASMTLTTALIAASRSIAAGRGLMFGCLAYGCTLALPVEPMLRVELAMVVGGLVAALVQWRALPE